MICKRTTFALLLCCVGCVLLHAQSTVITGKVTDRSGEPLMGATVVLSGSDKTGSVADMDGSYRLSVDGTLTRKDSLIFRYVGYKRKTVAYKGENVINVVLDDESVEMDNLVVTALGIRREEKSLGYATSTVNGDEITNTMPSNWSLALQGKVAGLNVITAGGPLSTTKIALRGDVSLNQNGNAALIVVDGVPLSSPMNNPGTSYGAGEQDELSVDYGNGFSDLNPEDIESIQVLKGASGTALYGSRAANGVVMVTTKSGKKDKKGLGVEYSMNFSLDEVSHWPNYQYEFGQGLPTYLTQSSTNSDLYELYYSYKAGNGLSNTGGTSSAYGPRFQGQYYYQYDPDTQARGEEATLWRPYKNNHSGLFQTGHTLTNSIAISNNTDRGSTRLSFTHSKNEWLLPNSGYERFSVSASANQQVSKRLKVNFKTSYTYRDIDNTPAMGYNSNSIAYFLIFMNPNFNLNWFKPMWSTGKENITQLRPFSSYLPNPYVLLYEAENTSLKHSVTSTASATLQISRKFDFMVRSGIQLTYQKQEQHRPLDDKVYPDGYFKTQSIFDYETNTDALLTFHDSFANGLHVNAVVGGNLMYSYYDSDATSVIGLNTPGVYKISNGASDPQVTLSTKKKAVYSLYFTTNFSYKDKLFLDITGRNDWSSTLPRKNRSFFYPSVSLSGILNEWIEMPDEISLLKLRASWAQVGNDTDPYKTSPYYTTSDFSGSLEMPTTLYNANLKPEISTSYELGFDFRMFHNRLGLDFTWYLNRTKNQILSAPIDSSTGYTKQTINAGCVQNVGYEVTLDATPIRTKDWEWTTTFTWALNRNRIMSLSDQADTQQSIGSYVSGNVSIIGTVGGTTADLWGYKLKRNEYGEVLIGSDGLPQVTDEIERVGTAYAKWKGGFNTSLKYKNWKLSMQWNCQIGGLIYSQSNHKMAEQGHTTVTLNGRLPGTKYYMDITDPTVASLITDAGYNLAEGVYMIAPGVVDNGDGTYSPNTTVIKVESYYKSYYKIGNVETNSFDASYLKLNELRLDYSFPKSLLKNSFIESASVGVYGRNLICFTSYPMYDPEQVSLDSSSFVSGVEVGTLPSSRTYGINLKVSF